MNSNQNGDGWTDKPGPVRPGKAQISIKERRMSGPNEQNEKLKAIGKRFTSPGFDYAGSIAIHIFKSQFGPIEVMTQNCVGPKVAPIEANFALQQASEAVAASYGIKRPATRQDLMNKDPHRGNRFEIIKNQVQAEVIQPELPVAPAPATPTTEEPAQ